MSFLSSLFCHSVLNSAMLLFAVFDINKYVHGADPIKDFKDKPYLVNTAVGRDATLMWTLKEPFHADNPSASLELLKATPKTSLVKYVNRRCVSSNGRFSCVVQKGGASNKVGFRIRGVVREDSGYYEFKCKASGQSQEKTDKAIFILVHELVVNLIGSTEIKQGDSTALTCNVTEQMRPDEFKEYIDLQYSWTYSRKPRHFRVDRDQFGVFEATGEDDGIKVTCIVHDTGVSPVLVVQKGFTLTVLTLPEKPQVLMAPEEALVRGRDRLIVKCKTKAKKRAGQVRVLWQNLDSRFNVTTGSTLRLNTLNPEQHDGRWQCCGVNSVGKGKPASFNVTVNARPVVVQDPSESYDILHTETLRAACKIVAKPTANVSWYYEDDRPLPTVVTHAETEVTYSRVFTMTVSVLMWNLELKPGDVRRDLAVGKYKCVAENSAGHVESKETSLSVYAGYQFCQPPPRYGHARVGAYLSVSLCLTGYPFRSITEKSWIFKPHNSDKVIPTLPDGATATLNNTDHPNMKMLILTIARVEDHHYGTYTLSIRNRFNRKNLVHSFSLSPGGLPIALIFGTVCALLVIFVSVLSVVGLWKSGTALTDDEEVKEGSDDSDTVEEYVENDEQEIDTDDDWEGMGFGTNEARDLADNDSPMGNMAEEKTQKNK